MKYIFRIYTGKKKTINSHYFGVRAVSVYLHACAITCTRAHTHTDICAYTHVCVYTV